MQVKIRPNSARAHKKDRNTTPGRSIAARPKTAQLQADTSHYVSGLRILQLQANNAVAQLAKGSKPKPDYANPTRHGSQKGKFVGAPHACHLHLDVADAHFKVGTSNNTRIDFDEDTCNHLMQEAYDELRTQYVGKPGYANCMAWFEVQGCKTP